MCVEGDGRQRRAIAGCNGSSLGLISRGPSNGRPPAPQLPRQVSLARYCCVERKQEREKTGNLELIRLAAEIGTGVGLITLPRPSKLLAGCLSSKE